MPAAGLAQLRSVPGADGPARRAGPEGPLQAQRPRDALDAAEPAAADARLHARLLAHHADRGPAVTRCSCSPGCFPGRSSRSRRPSPRLSLLEQPEPHPEGRRSAGRLSARRSSGRSSSTWCCRSSRSRSWRSPRTHARDRRGSCSSRGGRSWPPASPTGLSLLFSSLTVFFRDVAPPHRHPLPDLVLRDAGCSIRTSSSRSSRARCCGRCSSLNPATPDRAVVPDDHLRGPRSRSPRPLRSPRCSACGTSLLGGSRCSSGSRTATSTTSEPCPDPSTFQNVGMCFRMHREKVTTLKEAVLGRFRHLRDADEFWALRDVSLRASAPGESVGLIGHNGSGQEHAPQDRGGRAARDGGQRSGSRAASRR